MGLYRKRTPEERAALSLSADILLQACESLAPANKAKRGRPIVSHANPAKAKRNAQQAALMRKRRAKK